MLCLKITYLKSQPYFPGDNEELNKWALRIWGGDKSGPKSWSTLGSPTQLPMVILRKINYMTENLWLLCFYQREIPCSVMWSFILTVLFLIDENVTLVWFILKAIIWPIHILAGEIRLFRKKCCNWWSQHIHAPMLYHISLEWHHNERDGVSNHQHLDCLLNRLFRHRSKKTSKLHVTGLCEGNSPVNVTVTWKMFPFDDIIMDKICIN